jgi:hypothetical protein
MEYNISDIGEYFPIKITPGFIALTPISDVSTAFFVVVNNTLSGT